MNLFYDFTLFVYINNLFIDHCNSLLKNIDTNISSFDSFLEFIKYIHFAETIINLFNKNNTNKYPNSLVEFTDNIYKNKITNYNVINLNSNIDKFIKKFIYNNSFNEILFAKYLSIIINIMK